MSYTEDQIINRISTVLQDAGTAVFGTAEIRQAIDEGLIALAQEGRPYITLGTLTTSEGTKTLDYSSESDVLYVDMVEFRLNSEGTGSLDPPRFRNFKEISAGKILLDISFDPVDSENVRMYYAKPHLLSGTGTNTMNPREEQILINWCAGKAAMNKSMKLSQQVETALTNILAAGTAVSNMTAQIDLATAAVASATALINTKTLGAAPVDRWLNAAATDITTAQAHLSQSTGYLNEAAGRLTASNVSKQYQVWGANKLGVADRELRSIARRRVAKDWPRDV